MIKISNKKVKQRTVWLSAEGPSIRWDSRKLGIGKSWSRKPFLEAKLLLTDEDHHLQSAWIRSGK
jgi:hypothetical protein